MWRPLPAGLQEVRRPLPRAAVTWVGVTLVEAVAGVTALPRPDGEPLPVVAEPAGERLPPPDRRCRHTAALRRL